MRRGNWTTGTNAFHAPPRTVCSIWPEIRSLATHCGGRHQTGQGRVIVPHGVVASHHELAVARGQHRDGTAALEIAQDATARPR